ncbi:hypothetical protein L3X38_024285 [Prunus dulcis]|uniref:Reverse transcriptase Ty1/copia-type domain-containing protein n=1 Tax=Prunus dulcis TaxID=3755 RepID=A0AAD4W1H2_PRUDU|nr:hypothetical protein L3X38_024285 [Prunus dulcis]
MASSSPLLSSRVSINHRFLCFVDGSNLSPSPAILNPKAKNDDSSPLSLLPKPEYDDWVQKDQLVLTLINGFLHHKVLTTVATKTTGRDTWVVLETHFASPNQNSLQLRSDLLRKARGDSFIIDFLDRINSVVNNLAFASAPVSDYDLLVVVMNNVGPLYENIVADAQARETSINIHCGFLLLPLLGLLRPMGLFNVSIVIVLAIAAVYPSKASSVPSPPSHLQGMTAQHPSHNGHQQWVVDTGANTHITNELRHLYLAREYHGSDNVGGVLGGTGVRADRSMWHSRLGHPTSSTFQCLLSHNKLPSSYVYWRNSNGFIHRSKARLVANGFHQQLGLDSGAIVSVVVNHSTIRLILALSVQFGWIVGQLDVECLLAWLPK